MMKVYLVSKGCYSDFTIIGAFSTLEKAKDAVDYFNANEGIDEYEIDSEAKQRPAGMKAFRVAMDREGNVIVDEWNHKQVIHECSGSYADDNTVFGYGGYRETPTHASFHVWAKDEEHAIKIANEKRGAVLIADEWPK